MSLHSTSVSKSMPQIDSSTTSMSSIATPTNTRTNTKMAKERQTPVFGSAHGPATQSTNPPASSSASAHSSTEPPSPSSVSSVWSSVDDLLKNFASEHEQIAKRLKLIEERRRRRTHSTADEPSINHSSISQSQDSRVRTSFDYSPVASPSAAAAAETASTPSSSAFFARQTPNLSTPNPTRQAPELDQHHAKDENSEDQRDDSMHIDSSAVVPSFANEDRDLLDEEECSLAERLRGASVARDSNADLPLASVSSETPSEPALSLSSLQEISTLSSPSRLSNATESQTETPKAGPPLLSSSTAYFFHERMDTYQEQEETEELDENIPNPQTYEIAAISPPQSPRLVHATSSSNSSHFWARGVAAAAGILAVAGVLLSISPAKDRNSQSKQS